MKKNNKGFTLVELLAVIVVLAIIMIIVVRSVGTNLTESKGETLLIEAKAIQKDLNQICILNGKVTDDEVKAAVGTEFTYETNDKVVTITATSASKFANISEGYSIENVKGITVAEGSSASQPKINITLDCSVQ